MSPSPMDRFQEMASFVAVVDAGSFIRAAELSDLSKAAVSRHLNDLEHRLGVRLLHRTTRRLSLTAAGQAFYSRCKDYCRVAERPANAITRVGGVVTVPG
jgi:DNA-binding transcriptional LysR family regulator